MTYYKAVAEGAAPLANLPHEKRPVTRSKE